MAGSQPLWTSVGNRRAGLLTGWASAARCHPKTLDAVLASVFVLLALLADTVGPHAGQGGVSAGEIAAATAGFGLLMTRRRFPLAVLGLSVVGAVAAIAGSDDGETLRAAAIAVAIVAVFTVASETDRRTALVAGGATALVLFAASTATSTESWLAPENVAVVAWTGMANAIGDAVRSRRAYVAAVEERARRAELTREEEARRRVVEERLRIARELHDMLAHHIALISVQAGVAEHVLRSQPDQAEQALSHIRRASRAVLNELGALLNVLRESEDASVPTEPAPGLDRLPRLLDSFEAAGLRVESVVSGQPRPAPAAVDLAAYRVVQEALTNVHKHGGGAGAGLQLEYAHDELHIVVVNMGGSRPESRDPGTGHGVVGMRERALSVGGWAIAGQTVGAPFRLEASLPLPAPAAPDPQSREGGDHADPGAARR